MNLPRDGYPVTGTVRLRSVMVCVLVEVPPDRARRVVTRRTLTGAVRSRARVRAFSTHAIRTVRGWFTVIAWLVQAAVPPALVPRCTTVPGTGTETELTIAVPAGGMRGLLVCGGGGALPVEVGVAGGAGGDGAHAAVAVLANVISACAGASWAPACVPVAVTGDAQPCRLQEGAVAIGQEISCGVRVAQSCGG